MLYTVAVFVLDGGVLLLQILVTAGECVKMNETDVKGKSHGSPEPPAAESAVSISGVSRCSK
jgi:hypothetical protein